MIHAHDEWHASGGGTQLNWLRAAVLGANDGIVSVAAIVVGVAGASNSLSIILTAGVAGLVAGALSMAVGEYVSVSTQRDTEKALLEQEREELRDEPEEELAELGEIYEKKGLSRATARAVAAELTAHDAFAAHAEAELRINPEQLTNPWHASWASGLAFFSGAVIPLIAISLPPAFLRIPITFAAALVALIVTGALSAHAGGASKRTATIRVVAGGILAMAITFGIGTLFGGIGI
ncbi:MAG: VIT family protein [bacterium]|nr:VIT family protein [bacterium]